MQSDLFGFFFKSVVVVVMLTNWVAPQTIASLGTFGDFKSPVSVKSLFVESFDELQAPIFAKAHMHKGTVANAVGSIWASYWKASDKRGEIRDQARAAAAGQGLFAWLSSSASLTLQALGDKTVTFVMSIVVGLLAIVLMVVYLFVIFFGDVMVIIGMTLGPLMISCLLFLYKPIQGLFDKWVLFMVSAGFYKLIAALVAVLTMGSITTIQTQVTAMYAQAVADTTGIGPTASTALFSGGGLMSIVMTVLYMAFGIFLMLKVGPLVDSLMRGTVSTGAQAVQKAAAQPAEAAAKAAAA
jgi:hypothetical protein